MLCSCYLFEDTVFFMGSKNLGANGQMVVGLKL